MIMFSLLTSAFLLLSFSESAIALSSCVVFDSSWNLLVFGLNGKDWSAGTQDSWASGTATDITTAARPPFDGNATTCYLSQFANLIYVMGADSSNPTSISIYDVAATSWSTQSVTTGSFDPTQASFILDHDTDVFYGFGAGEMWFVTMNGLKTATSTPLPYMLSGTSPWDTTGYNPVMALGKNHIHFLDLPGVAAGSADIFVIHFGFFQPATQAYGNFPATHGQTASVFLADSTAQQEFIFIPDDGSATYVINVVTNTTQTLPGPAKVDASAMYFAAPTTFVQLTSSGTVAFMPYQSGTPSASTSWTAVQNLASLPAGSSGSTSGGSSSAGSSSGTATKAAGSPGSSGTKTASGTGASGTGTGTSSTSSGTPSNGASSNRPMTLEMTAMLLVGSFALSLLY